MRLLALLALGACTAPTIELTLTASSEITDTFSTSCVSAVRLQLNGAHHLSDPEDVVENCYDIPFGTTVDTFAQVKEVVHGRFDLDLPESGLSGAEVYGYAGACSDSDTTATLAFVGSGTYTDGSAGLTIVASPNVSCTKSTVSAQLVDVSKLAPGTTNANCADAIFTAASGLVLSTYAPVPFGGGVEQWGYAKGDVASGLASVPDATTEVGIGSCLVASYLDGAGNPVSSACITTDAQNVCTGGGQREVGILDPILWQTAVDQTRLDAFHGMVVGIVYNPTTGPVAGVTVSLANPDDENRAAISYLKRTGSGTTLRLAPLDAAVTDESGLFAVYTHSLVVVHVEKGTAKIDRKVGAVDPDHVAAMIVRL